MYNKVLLTDFIHKLSSSKRAVENPRGTLVRVILDAKVTYFDITDYMKFSRKTRRTVSFEKQKKTLLQYTYVGKPIKFNSNYISTTLTMRNSHMLFSYETIFHLFFTCCYFIYF